MNLLRLVLQGKSVVRTVQFLLRECKLEGGSDRSAPPIRDSV